MKLANRPVHITVEDAKGRPTLRLKLPFGQLPDRLKLRLICELMGECYEPSIDRSKKPTSSFFSGGRRYMFDGDGSLKNIIHYEAENRKIPHWVREAVEDEQDT